MGAVDRVVSAILRSPLHRVLSGSTDLVRYVGRRSGREYSTPTQYVRHGDGLVILVGRPVTKTWWRNFRTERDVEVLLGRRWVPMTARAVVGADEPDVIAPLLTAYLTRFPRVARMFTGNPDRTPEQQSVVVWCRPR